MKYPKIKSVKPMEKQRLWVVFDEGTEKLYDCAPLLAMKAFEPLQHVWLFNQVKVDTGGYGISWNDEIDLAESELWLNGVETVNSTQRELTALA